MRPPDVRMNWDNLLFLHWRVEPSMLRRLVPEPLELDLFDGSAWIALVPFRMRGSIFRGVPALPGLADFYECNVRTYVRFRSRPGVWFFSLDAQTLLPVLGGRLLWSLNYILGRFDVERQGDVTTYRLTRRRGPWTPGRTHIAWRSGELLRPQGQPPDPQSIEHFLTERYWLFTRRRARILAGEVLHAPWPLRKAELLHLDDSLISAAGVRVAGEPLVLASTHLAVEGRSLIDPA